MMKHRPTAGTAVADNARWLRTFPASRPRTELHVVCFPPAGGAAGSFAALRQAADPATAVSIAALPGREARLGEPAAGDLGEVADTLAARLSAIGIGEDAPYVLLGHSLGGLTAYETALRLERAEAPGPLELAVVASAAPDAPVWAPTARTPPTELLRRLGGAPPELFEHPELLAFAARALADDLKMLAGYRCAAAAHVTAPLHVLSDPEDTHFGTDTVAGWSRFSTARTRFEHVDGGHFPLENPRLCHRLLTGWRSAPARSPA